MTNRGGRGQRRQNCRAMNNDSVVNRIEESSVAPLNRFTNVEIEEIESVKVDARTFSGSQTLSTIATLYATCSMCMVFCWIYIDCI